MEKMLTKQPTIHENCMITDSKIGDWTEIGMNSYIDKSEIGEYTYTAGFNQINYAKIGKFCSFASFVRINPGNHPIERVTQHHMTYRRKMFGLMDTDDEEFFAWRESNKVTIGNDVWLGHNVCVMPDVTIGDGAVVGSGGIVTKDIEPYSICVGVPAKHIRYRFTKEQIDAIRRIAYWDWSYEELKERLLEFNDVKEFIEKYIKEA